jgi:hypothetical protein
LRDGLDLVGAERTGRRTPPGSLARRQDRNAADLERAQQRPVAVDEAQHSTDPYVGVACKRALDNVDLTKHAADELRAIPSTDDEVLRSRVQQAAAVFDGDASRVPRGVDDEHAARADRQMIDVRAGAGNPPVVQENDSCPDRVTLELSGHNDLTIGTFRPVALILGFAAEGERDTGKPPEPLSDPCFPIRSKLLGLAPGAGAGRRRHRGRRHVAAEASDFAPRGVPRRKLACGELQMTARTAVLAPELETPYPGRHDLGIGGRSLNVIQYVIWP